MIKKVCVFLLVVTTTIFLLNPLISFAAEDSGIFNNIKWSLDKKGTLTLEDGNMIPPNGPWMIHSKNIKSIIIGDGIKEIKSEALENLPNLVSVSLGKDVLTLGREAFTNCKKLKTLSILGEKTKLSGISFYGNTFTEFILPDNSNYIITDNCVLSKDGKDLVYCLGAKSINVPVGVTSIREGAFYSNNKTVTITLPNTLETIDQSAFANCSSLESIIIPASVSTLNESSFFNCEKLKSLVFQGNHITINGIWTFTGCFRLQSVVLPAATFQNVLYTDNGRESMSFMDCGNLQTFVFSEGTEEIPGGFFTYCIKLKDVYIPASVTKIHYTAFSRESKNLVIRCIEGSYAEQFATNNGFKYKYYTPTTLISLSQTELLLKKGKTATLKQTAEPQKVSIKDVHWFSTDESIATVTKGKVKANGVGECDIICQAMDGSGVRTTCHVIVQE